MDLKKQTLKVGPILLTWNPVKDRIRLQVNRDWVRGKLKLARAASKPYWKGSYRRSKREYLKYLSTLSYDVQNAIDDGLFIYPDTIRVFNQKLEALAVRTLCSVFKTKRKQAKQEAKNYIHHLTDKPLV